MPTPPPTQETFDKLLLLFNPDRARAGEEYELLRLKLLVYFRARTCQRAEELTDETLNRLARKVAEGEDLRDVLRYCYGLARWVWIEERKKPEANLVNLDDAPAPQFVSPDFLLQQERRECFYYCLRELPDGERMLIVGYWDHENQKHHEARRELARDLRLTPTALRIRVSRIQKKLKACFSNCLEQGPAKLKRS